MNFTIGPVHSVSRGVLFSHIVQGFHEGKSEYHTITPTGSDIHFNIHNDNPEGGYIGYRIEDGGQSDVVAFMQSGLYVFSPAILSQLLVFWASGLFVQCTVAQYDNQLVVREVSLYGRT